VSGVKTALVTGGNRGIGYAACKELAGKGFRVFLGSREFGKGEEACARLREAGVTQVEPLELDVGDEQSIRAAVEKLAARTKKLDVLVNNAGVYLDQSADALTVTPDAILTTFRTNTLGPLLLTRALAPLLAGEGQVINVSSGMGQLDDMQGGSAAYRISKTALNAVTRILSAELAAQHIHVNSICPGWVHTDMGSASAPRTPEQGADTIVWLAGGGAGHASGGFYRDRKAIAW
jgi:NAD(P)-dependent dehydrogenase (short-subunit alcohol dehydrogenase family)